jgi:peptidoglycan/LPS O-acetylase OafA/YrhL
VTFLSGAARTRLEQLPRFTGKRAIRLLVPFLLFGLVTVAGKFLAARFIYVDNLPASLTQALVGLLWLTDRSPATSVWYVAVLFVLCVATPALLRLFRGRTSLLVALAMVAYLLPVPHVAYLDRVARYALFFVLGGVAADAGEQWLAAVDRLWWWALAGLAGALACFSLPQFAQLPPEFKLALVGILSMPALHGFVRGSGLGRTRGLLVFGSFSFVIYLLNTPFIGLTKGLLLKAMSWDGQNFLLFAPLLMLAGMAGPMLVKRFIVDPVPALRRNIE